MPLTPWCRLGPLGVALGSKGVAAHASDDPQVPAGIHGTLGPGGDFTVIVKRGGVAAAGQPGVVGQATQICSRVMELEAPNVPSPMPFI